MNIKPLERDKYIRSDEFKALLAWADKQKDKRLWMFIFVGGALGLRQTEARTLNRDINFTQLDENTVNVRSLKKRDKRQDGSKRDLPFLTVRADDYTREALRNYLAEFTSDDQPWLFPGRKGPISARKAVAWFKSAVIGAKLNPRYSYHALRHYRGIILWNTHHNLDLIKKELRHSDIKTSSVYVHMDGKEQIELIKGVNPFDDKSGK